MEMTRYAGLLAGVLLGATASAGPDAGECLAVWIETKGAPVECKADQLAEAIDHQPRMCLAKNADTAVVRVRLTACLKGPSIAIPEAGAAVVEHVIQAQVTEANVSRQLTGRDNHSWAGALADLCDSIVAWHAKRGQETR